MANNGKTLRIDSRLQITPNPVPQLVTRLLKIDPNRLWATFFAGDRISGHYFEEDLETRQAWQEVGLPTSRLVGLGAEHNFWKQGGGIDGQETSRKCGPYTELFLIVAPT